MLLIALVLLICCGFSTCFNLPSAISPISARNRFYNYFRLNKLQPIQAVKNDERIIPQTGYTNNFITNLIDNDISTGKYNGRTKFRFPPEPNGCLHIGHAKSIFLNFGLAKRYNGSINVRLDDTNPSNEDDQYVLSILNDIEWLLRGGEWPSYPVKYASDYYPIIFLAATILIEKDVAYVDELSAEDMKLYRGTLTQPGRDSPYRNRSREENLQLFKGMREGLYEEGRYILRAKINNSHPNLNMRDPVLYRIKYPEQVCLPPGLPPLPNQSWCIYPMYDIAHVVSDMIEGITHSLCSLEFELHRPLYNWFIDQLLPSYLFTDILPQVIPPQQIEFSRLNIQYNVLSKRKMSKLVEEGIVSDWEDLRLLTLGGLRARGYPPEAIELFCNRIGISKAENCIDISVLEDCAREVLDSTVPRGYAVSEPIRVIIDNWPAGTQQQITIANHPTKESMGTRQLHFCEEVFIDRSDFFDTGVNEEIPIPAGYKRLVPHGSVRLKNAYVIHCDEVIRDENGKVTELHCSYDKSTFGGVTPVGTKRVKGIIQWVSAIDAVPCQFKVYDRLFNVPIPGKERDYMEDVNPKSLQCLHGYVEQNILQSAAPSFQFERFGYFHRIATAAGEVATFNRIVQLRENWKHNDGQ